MIKSHRWLKNSRARVTQVLGFGSICQGAILAPLFEPQPNGHPTPRHYQGGYPHLWLGLSLMLTRPQIHRPPLGKIGGVPGFCRDFSLLEGNTISNQTKVLLHPGSTYQKVGRAPYSYFLGSCTQNLLGRVINVFFD